MNYMKYENRNKEENLKRGLSLKDYDSLSALVTIISTDNVNVFIPSGTHLITADLTIPSNVTLTFENGGILSVATTKTLTLNCGIEAGSNQIFAGAGTFIGNSMMGVVYPEWFGATGDGVTDDTTAIQKAIDFAEASDVCVKFSYKNTYIVSYVGTKVDTTWHTSNKRYSLQVGSNVEIDLNGSTLQGTMYDDGGNDIPINIIGNKLSSNAQAGNDYITIRNGIIDNNTSLTYDSSVIGNYDIHAVDLNNVRNLVLKDLLVTNCIGYGIYLCNAQDFKLLGDIEVTNVLGCCLRIGWHDDGTTTERGYIENLIFKNSDNSQESYVPANTLYMQAIDVSIRSLVQSLDDAYVPVSFDFDDYDDYDIGSVNIANHSNNIHIDYLRGEYCGVKFQDYSDTATASPDNIHVVSMDIKNLRFTQQAKTFICDNLFAYNCDIQSSNSYFQHVKNLKLENSPKAYLIKTNLAKVAKFDNIITVDAPSISSSSTSLTIYIDNLYAYRNSADMVDDNTTKYLVEVNTVKEAYIGKVFYDITQTASVRTAYIKLPNGGVIRSVTGQKTATDGLSTDYDINSFTITLTAGTTTTINLQSGALDGGDNSVYKNGNNMNRSYRLVPLSTDSRAIDITKAIENNNAEHLTLTHSTAAGTETFFVEVYNYLQADTIS